MWNLKKQNKQKNWSSYDSIPENKWLDSPMPPFFKNWNWECLRAGIESKNQNQNQKGPNSNDTQPYVCAAQVVQKE